MSLLPTAGLQDCWNQVGVQGDGTCPRLDEFFHCRNCPVYRSAAARGLHGEPPADYLAEWTARLAEPPAATSEPNTASVMIFRLGAEWLALPASIFQEVAEPRPVHSLPHRRGKGLQGLVNVRGELVVCVSLAGTLGIDENSAVVAADTHHMVYRRLVVVGTDGGRLAFPVTEVHGIEGFAPSQLRPVPATLGLSSSRYTRGILAWQGRRVGCLDSVALFTTLNRSLG